ncbi:transposase, partial [Candidatus Micrarchaeota archaeon]|nr:transposase [Candidatus Micrarchaeota archaeon]
TGLKVYNSGEWIRKYGKKRQWVKLHVSLDVKTHKFIVALVTKKNVADTKKFRPLVKGTLKRGNPRQVNADKAYDGNDNYALLEKHRIAAGIPLRKIAKGRFLKGKRARRRAMKEQFGVDNRRNMKYRFTEKMEKKQKKWKKKVGYGDRWQVETGFSSFKGMFGEYVYSKNWDLIKQEVAIKVELYNGMM